jgi:hypothetical protein
MAHRNPLYPRLSYILLSLDEPLPKIVHSTYPMEIDNLEYSRVKATSVSVRLRIYL